MFHLTQYFESLSEEVVLNSIISIHKVLKYNKTAKKAKKLPKFKAAENSMLRVTEDIIYRVV